MHFIRGNFDACNKLKYYRENLHFTVCNGLFCTMNICICSPSDRIWKICGPISRFKYAMLRLVVVDQVSSFQDQVNQQSRPRLHKTLMWQLVPFWASKSSRKLNINTYFILILNIDRKLVYSNFTRSLERCSYGL